VQLQNIFKQFFDSQDSGSSPYKQASKHPFNGPFSGTTRVSRYQKGKINLDFTEARDSEWQWHQLGHMQVCTSFQTDNHASTTPIKFFTGRMPFLPPNQQRQSTVLSFSASSPYKIVEHYKFELYVKPAAAACGGRDRLTD